MEVRIATYNDKNNIKSFIDNYWKNNHILSTSDQIFDFQHLSNNKNELHYAIAVEGNEILAILGFIPLCKYDHNLIENRDIWLAIWKVIDKAPKGIGLKLLTLIEEIYSPVTIGSIGINLRVKKLYSLLKFKTFTLNQYYIENPKLNNYNLIKLSNNNSDSIIYNDQIKEVNLVNINEEELIKEKIEFSLRPYKSINYIINRYLKHPYFKYQLFGIYINNKLCNIFVCRKIEVKELKSSCYRIVDIIGDFKFDYSIKKAFQQLLIEEKCEYIDCYNYGIEESYFKKLGFKQITEEVIPNYFEPFVKKTIKIMCAVKNNSKDNYVVFKGDSDQDRPNKL